MNPTERPDFGTPKMDNEQRNAMRAFLQRSEVRISTMHRIGLAFIGGAGLLLLIPVFFKDVIDGIIEILLANTGNQFPDSSIGPVLTILMFGFLSYPLLLSLSVPLYAVYLLLKDIVHFYFTVYMPGFPSSLLNPTFSLSGLLFWKDEEEAIKREVMRYQYAPGRMDFMLPFSEEKRAEYFDSMIERTQGEIIPSTRNLQELKARGFVPQDARDIDVLRFNAALGLTRSIDRTLIEDVAYTEMLMARYVLYLRRLMLRYIKTLFLFIWTTVISFIMLPFLNDKRIPVFIVLGIGYTVWSLLVMQFVKTPISWIYRHRHGNDHPDHIDPQLTLLENNISRLTAFSVASSAAGLLMALAAYF